jgi:hypothetical protein
METVCLFLGRKLSLFLHSREGKNNDKSRNSVFLAAIQVAEAALPPEY